MRYLARVAGLAIVLPVLLVGCSSPAKTVKAASPTSPQADASTSPATAAPAPITPSTGTQLTAALVSVVPAGFKLSKAGTTDTGSEMEDEQNGSMESRSHCANLDATSWIQTSGMSGVSFSQSDYLDHHDQEIAQEIDSFDSPADAARTMSQLKAFMLKCTSYRDSSSGPATYHVVTSSVAGLGTAAIKGVITSSHIDGGVVEIASLTGDNVTTTLYSARKLSTAEAVKSLTAEIDKNLTS